MTANAHRKGYGLVKRVKLEERPLVLSIGGEMISVTITRLGDQTASLVVAAPPDMVISFSEGHTMHESIEAAIASVLQEGH